MYHLARFLGAWQPFTVPVVIRYAQRAFAILISGIVIPAILVMTVINGDQPGFFTGASLTNSIGGILLFLPSPFLFISVVVNLNKYNDFFTALRRCMRQQSNLRPVRIVSILLFVASVISTLLAGAFLGFQVFVAYWFFYPSPFPSVYAIFMSFGWVGYTLYFYGCAQLCITFKLLELDAAECVRRVSNRDLPLHLIPDELDRFVSVVSAVSTHMRAPLLVQILGICGSAVVLLYGELLVDRRPHHDRNLLTLSMVGGVFIWLIAVLYTANASARSWTACRRQSHGSDATHKWTQRRPSAWMPLWRMHRAAAGVTLLGLRLVWGL